MKAVILAGGLGTRLSEETETKPKPMVEIGTKPMLWHIMKTYSQYGINDFIVCLGYKGFKIKEFFFHYNLHRSDITVDVRNGVKVHESFADPWRVTLVDTGEGTMTGGRLKRIRKYLEGEDTFCMTYGDGVCDVNIADLVAFHKARGTKATVTAVHPSTRFGALTIEGDKVKQFQEKPVRGEALINGGYFVLSPSVLDYVDDDATVWEQGPMERLAKEGQLSAYTHEGFWQCMDTIRDKKYLEELWASGHAPWRVWSED